MAQTRILLEYTLIKSFKARDTNISYDHASIVVTTTTTHAPVNGTDTSF